jgi:hypothetical protein
MVASMDLSAVAASTIAYMVDQALAHAAGAEPAAVNERSDNLHWVILATADRDSTMMRVACLTAADVDTIATLRPARHSLAQMVLELPCDQVWTDVGGGASVLDQDLPSR